MMVIKVNYFLQPNSEKRLEQDKIIRMSNTSIATFLFSSRSALFAAKNIIKFGLPEQDVNTQFT